MDDDISRMNTEKTEGEIIFDHLRNFKQPKDKKTITKEILKMLQEWNPKEDEQQNEIKKSKIRAR